MAILGKPSVNLAEVLRKPPDATSGKAKTSGVPSEGFRRIFQQVRADRSNPTADVSSTRETSATTRTAAPVEAGPNERAAPPPGESRRGDVPTSETATSNDTRAASLASKEATSTGTPQQRTTGAPDAAFRTDEGTAMTVAETSESGKAFRFGELAVANASDIDLSVEGSETGSETHGDASAEVEALSAQVPASALTAVSSEETAELRPDATTTMRSEEPAETTTLSTAPVDPSIVLAGSGDVAAKESISESAGSVPPSGKDFPAATVHRENISTENLLRALEQEVIAAETSERTSERTSGWHRQLFVAADEPLDPVALTARGRAETPDVLSAVALARAEAGRGLRGVTDPRTLGSELFAAGRRGGVGRLGTLHALNPTRSTDMPLRGVGSTWSDAETRTIGRTWFGSEAAPRRTSVDAARTAIQRRAASAAFAKTRTSLFRQALDVGAARAMSSQAVDGMARQNARAIDAASASFVRSQRMRAHGSVGGAMGQASANDVRVAEPVAQAAAGTPAPAGSNSAASASPATTTVQQAYSPLMEFIANETRRQLRLGKREFRIQLNPESLGSVELEVIVEGNALVVRLKAASEESQRILEENLDDLEAALAERGMTLDVETPWKSGRRAAVLESRPRVEEAVV